MATSTHEQKIELAAREVSRMWAADHAADGVP